MAEIGGPTTQSGILYQNSISALYLGALLDLRRPIDGSPRIIAVRVEAPEDIDDTVVTYANGSSLYIQAKENFALQGDVWKSFWSSVRNQTSRSRNKDRFHLVLGTLGSSLERLRETLGRAQGKENINEWLDALDQEQKKIGHSILDALELSEHDALTAIKRTHAVLITLNQAETSGVRDWMPESSVAPLALYSHLRDCCGGAARIRHVFRASELSESLLRKYSVRVWGSSSEGLERYSRAIAAQVDHIGVPGTSIALHESALFVWPTIVSVDKNLRADFDDEDALRSRDRDGKRVNLRDFPSSEMNAVILESGAGQGKSTILRATARRLATKTTIIPALMHAEALSDHQGIQDYLNNQYNTLYGVSIDWTALCEKGQVAVIIDGVDELNDGARAAIVNMVGRAAAQFPEMPILVGARDASVATFPPKFQLFRVRRLNDEQMTEMLDAYVASRGGLDLQAIVRHIKVNRELHTLCRIPLFLAIFVATIPKRGVIPASRTDVLEQYILHALSPDRYKGTARPTVSKTQLRRGAEVVASLSLSRNEAAVSEITIRTLLSKELGDAVGDEAVDALLRCGLLERRGSRIAFCLPTIQEYLAGCVLAESGSLKSNEWFEKVYRRPWAQAVQFCVEKLKDADSILRQQLEREDDIYHTSLRLVARCVVNGASVSESLKGSIASRLAGALRKAGYRVRMQIGDLIFDGFCGPMGSEIRKAVIDGVVDDSQRASILLREKDNNLAIACLKSILKSEDVRELWNDHWHEVISPVVSEAFTLLLARAREEDGDTLTSSVIAESIFNFKDEAKIDWTKITCDETLPLAVRAAASFGLLKDSVEPDPKLIEQAIVNSHGHSPWRGFGRAYVSTSWWRNHFTELCRSEPDLSRGYALRYIYDLDVVSQDQVDLFKQIVADELTHPVYRFHMQILLGALGMFDYAESATDDLVNVELESVHHWIFESPYFPDDVVLRGVDIILCLNIHNSDKISLFKSLVICLEEIPSEKRASVRGGGPYTIKKDRRGLLNKLIEYGDNLIESRDIDEFDRKKLISMCAQCGSISGVKFLKLEMEEYLDNNDYINGEDWNNWFASCVKDNFLDLDAKILWQILEKAGNLPMHGVVRQLIKKEGASCYPALADFVNSHPGSSVWSAVYFYFEQNAEREGVIVRRVSGNVEIKKI